MDFCDGISGTSGIYVYVQSSHKLIFMIITWPPPDPYDVLVGLVKGLSSDWAALWFSLKGDLERDSHWYWHSDRMTSELLSSQRNNEFLLRKIARWQENGIAAVTMRGSQFLNVYVHVFTLQPKCTDHTLHDREGFASEVFCLLSAV